MTFMLLNCLPALVVTLRCSRRNHFEYLQHYLDRKGVKRVGLLKVVGQPVDQLLLLPARRETHSTELPSEVVDTDIFEWYPINLQSNLRIVLVLHNFTVFPFWHFSMLWSSVETIPGAGVPGVGVTGVDKCMT